ncbi:hypothetical protein BE21_43450 [Sorangium cellulosum]|uniref:Uncharacterized protein n=1 Tax=Sorangium cellulosum TaxID=56 RepID=A0A150TK92_SORCE|nr:hypothetical protein BE21_43450 [Sorangium cellulosum]
MATSKTKKPAPATSPAEAPIVSPTTVTLDALARELGPADGAFAARTYAGIPEEDLVAEGTRIDSQSLIDDAPHFVASARRILGSLSGSQRAKVRMPDALLPLLVAEAGRLQAMKRAHDAEATEAAGARAALEVQGRSAMRDGIGERDLCYDGLRNALGARRMARVDAVVGRADSPESLAKGLEALASFIEETRRADPVHDAQLLEDYGVGADCAASLRATAQRVRGIASVQVAAGRRVTQRALDLQDGRVAVVIEKILRAFRAARRVDGTILVPELNKAAWMFEARSGSSAKKAPPGGDKPPPGGSGSGAQGNAPPVPVTEETTPILGADG